VARLKSELPALTAEILKVSTQEELDKLYTEYATLMTEDFIPRGKQRGCGRKKFFWNSTLARRTKERSALYKVWKLSNEEEDKTAYKLCRDEVRREIRRAKRKSSREYIESLVDDQEHNAVAHISKIRKARENRAFRSSTMSDTTLRLENFTKHVATKFPASPEILGQHFELDEKEMTADITEAIGRSGRKKAAGSDGIFNEGLRLETESTATFLFQLWKRCGEIAKTPTKWDFIILVPIHKAGPREIEKNHRPVSLMSHVRKIIEKAVDLKFRREVTFAIAQCGFRPRTGTEHALLRLTYATRHGHNSLAILDIKGAFPSVRRDKLMKKVRERLPKQTANMISHFLKPTTIVTKGDPKQATERLLTGVPEGGSISPALFNLYIDDLAEELGSMGVAIALIAAIIFADDIILLARTLAALQVLLDTCTRWAEKNEITFGTDKCYALHYGVASTPLMLQGAVLQKKRKAPYLGTVVTFRGVHHSTFNKRRNLLNWRSAELRRAGFTDYIHPALGRKIFTSLLCPVLDYALHLVPTESESAQNSIERILKAEFLALRAPTYLIGSDPKRRMYNIYALYDIKTRRKVAASNLWQRLQIDKQTAREEGDIDAEWMKEIEIEGLEELYTKQELMLPYEVEQKRRAAIERSRKRKICCQKVHKHPGMLLRSRTLSRFATRYHAGRALQPTHKTILNSIFDKPTVDSWRKKIRDYMQAPELNEDEREDLIEHLFLVTDHYAHPPREDTRYAGGQWIDTCDPGNDRDPGDPIQPLA